LQRQVLEGALVAYHTPNEAKWKIALVTVSYKLDEKGIKKEISEAKRYYYVVGQENIHTALSQLGSLKGKVNTLEDLIDTFSIEKVTKEFFEEVAGLFYDLVGGSIRRSNKTEAHKKLLKLPYVVDEKAERVFAIKLLSRLIFAWFLKEKGLIGDNILSLEAVSNYKGNVPIELRAYDSYYHSVLEPLFFEILNKKQSDREQILKNCPLFKDVPFLNGGIFDPKRNEDFYNKAENVLFKRPTRNLVIPNEWLERLFKLFERYNFTVDESTPIDIDISIDPEMLGRIFENLLAEINEETQETARKSTGSYYTPRNIVDYMVTGSLKNYLENKTILSSQEVESLLSYQEESIELSERKKKEVIEAIDDIKIIDPACGSGAFPMGILQKLLLVLNKVDPENKYWIEKKFSKIDDSVIKEREKEKWLREKEETNYLRKLGLLRDSIYGIDIQPYATEISRLRAFLTLIVDKRVDKNKESFGIDPLPNLDFKFVTANSLIDVEKIDESNKDKNEMFYDTFYEELEKLTSEYFYSYDHEKKEKLREKIERLINQKVTNKEAEIFSLRNSLSGNYDRKLTKKGKELEEKYSYEIMLWESYKNIFKDKPVEFFNVKYFFPTAKDGFDIVIANPPYIKQQKIKDQKSYLEMQGYKVFSGTADLYVYFYEKGYELLKKGGILTFISSNKWMRAKYGEKLRKFIKENTLIKELIDFGGYRVFTATVDTNIIIFEKSEFDSTNEFFYLNIGDDFDGVHLSQYFNEKASVMSQKDLNDSGWTLAEDKVLSLKKKIDKIGKPLKYWDVEIYRGILTGFNDAFIIDTDKRNEILSNCKTEEERKRTEEIIKPILRGRDIGKYYYKWAGLWIIKIESGWTDKNRGKERPEEFFKEIFPSIYEHFMSFVGIKGKGKGLFDRDDQGDYWWELRDCDYYSEFEKEKIVWAETDQMLNLAIIPKGMYLQKTCFMIITNKKNLLIGLLNSKVSQWYIRNISSNLGKSGMSLSKESVERIPLPSPTFQNQPIVSQIESLIDQILAITKQPDYDPDSSTKETKEVKSLESQIDQLVYQLYGLTGEEIKIIEGVNK
jgi:uncharacterized LabA/DUF88 family protein